MKSEALDTAIAPAAPIPYARRKAAGRRMPTYAISLLHNPGDEPSNGIEPEERQFANLGEALQRGREMYRAHESSAIGFRICDALGEVIHEWRRS